MKFANVIIADDHPVFFEGLSMLVKRHQSVGRIVHAENGAQVLEILKENQGEFQIIFMDISMPVMDGITATFEIKKLYPDVRIIGMSQHDDQRRIKQMIKNGASAYLLKISGSDIIFAAIDAVLENRRYFSTSVADFLFENQIEKKTVDLSQRELEVLQELVKGKSIKEIAFEKGLAESSIITFKKRLFEKTDTSSIHSLISFALANDLA
jgi:DNA-binding NarL/FixJ family response regulator